MGTGWRASCIRRSPRFRMHRCVRMPSCDARSQASPPSAIVKAGFLARVPIDPYDGKPLRWIRTPTGAMAYSVGRDKIDNGGNWKRTNLMADGVDYGFELWDPKMRGVPAPVENK